MVMSFMEKIKQRGGQERGTEGVFIVWWVVREGFTKKVTFELIPAGGEGVSQVNLLGERRERTFQAEQTASGKTLQQG